MASVNTLLMYPHLNIVLYGMGNVARLVRPGRTVIEPHMLREGPTCGLVPIKGCATATTRGLKYNLNGEEMAFGGLISTSNTLEGGEVEVETDRELLWITEV